MVPRRPRSMTRRAKESFQPEQRSDRRSMCTGRACLVGLTELKIRFICPCHHITYILKWEDPYDPIWNITCTFSGIQYLPQLSTTCDFQAVRTQFLRFRLENDPIRKKIWMLQCATLNQISDINQLCHHQSSDPLFRIWYLTTTVTAYSLHWLKKVSQKGRPFRINLLHL